MDPVLSQVGDSTLTIEQSTISNTALTALQHVVRGDKERLAAIEELDGQYDSQIMNIYGFAMLSFLQLSRQG